MHFKHNRYYDGLKSTEEVQRVEYVLLKIGEYVLGEKCWGGQYVYGQVSVSQIWELWTT